MERIVEKFTSFAASDEADRRFYRSLSEIKDWPFCSSSLRSIKSMKLQKDLRQFIALLNSTAVNYMVVGGHAVAFHGFPQSIGKQDLIANKRASCRPQDLADLARLEKE